MRARRPEQKGIRWMAVMAVFLLIAAACTGATTETTDGTIDATTTAPPDDGGVTTTAASAEESTTTTAAAAEGPRTGGTLTFARFFETQSLDPMGVADNGSIFVRVQIFNTL